MRTKLPALGGEMEVDVNREDVIQAATFAAEAMTNPDMRVQLHRVTKATFQVMTFLSEEQCFEVNFAMRETALYIKSASR